MKNQIFKSILSLVLSATLLLGGVSPALAAETSKPEINVTEETKTISKAEADSVSKQLTLNAVKTDYLATKDAENWYKFTTTTRGYFTLNFTINNATDFDDIDDGWKIAIYSSTDFANPIKAYEAVKSNFKFPALPMPAGTYYIKIWADYDYSDSYAPTGCKYDLKVAYTNSSVWEVEGNNTNATPNTIALDTTYYGTLYNCKDVDWYKTSVSSNGYLKLKFGVHSSTNINDIDDGWSVYIYDKDYNLVKGFADIKSNFTFPTLPMAKGTYYVRVQADYNYSDGYAPTDCIYTLNLDHTANSVWETEYNNANTTADTIKVGKTYYGTLYKSTDIDWYKVETTKTGYFKVQLALDSSVNVDDIDDGWKLSVYDANLNEIITYSDIKTTFTTDAFAYPAGTYYVKVFADYDYSDSYAPTDCIYKLKVTETESKYWESEGNNARNKSDKISLNKTYKGFLMNENDQDWYKFTLSAAGKVKLTLSKDSSVNVDDVKDGWKVYLYKTDSSKAVCELKEIQTTASTEVSLAKGTYYIKVVPDWSYACPTRETYNLSVKYAQTPAKVTGLKATAGKKQVALKWKQSKKADGYYIYRSTSKKGTYTKVATIKKGSTVKYTDKKLKAKKTYYYKVVAYNTDNGVTATASASAIVNKKTK